MLNTTKKSNYLLSLIEAEDWTKIRNQEGFTVEAILSPLNPQSTLQNTALHLAIEKEDSPLLEILLELLKKSGKPIAEVVNTRNTDGQTPLHWACSKLFLGITRSDSDRRNPEVLKRLEKRALKLVTLLLDAGADIHARDKKGYTPLLSAIESRSGKLVELLCEKGSDFRQTTETFDNVFHLTMAGQENTIALFSALLKALKKRLEIYFDEHPALYPLLEIPVSTILSFFKKDTNTTQLIEARKKYVNNELSMLLAAQNIYQQSCYSLLAKKPFDKDKVNLKRELFKGLLEEFDIASDPNKFYLHEFVKKGEGYLFKEVCTYLEIEEQKKVQQEKKTVSALKSSKENAEHSKRFPACLNTRDGEGNTVLHAALLALKHLLWKYQLKVTHLERSSEVMKKRAEAESVLQEALKALSKEAPDYKVQKKKLKQQLKDLHSEQKKESSLVNQNIGEEGQRVKNAILQQLDIIKAILEYPVNDVTIPNHAFITPEVTWQSLVTSETWGDTLEKAIGTLMRKAPHFNTVKPENQKREFLKTSLLDNQKEYPRAYETFKKWLTSLSLTTDAEKKYAEELALCVHQLFERYDEVLTPILSTVPFILMAHPPICNDTKQLNQDRDNLYALRCLLALLQNQAKPALLTQKRDPFTAEQLNFLIEKNGIQALNLLVRFLVPRVEIAMDITWHVKTYREFYLAHLEEFHDHPLVASASDNNNNNNPSSSASKPAEEPKTDTTSLAVNPMTFLPPAPLPPATPVLGKLPPDPSLSMESQSAPSPKPS
jgi:ankyrin repeat protein